MKKLYMYVFFFSSLFWEYFMFWIYLLQFIVIPVGAAVVVMRRSGLLYCTKILLDSIQMADVIKLFFTGYYDRKRSKVIHNFNNVAKYAKYTFFYM